MAPNVKQSVDWVHRQMKLWTHTLFVLIIWDFMFDEEQKQHRETVYLYGGNKSFFFEGSFIFISD